MRHTQAHEHEILRFFLQLNFKIIYVVRNDD